MDNPTHLTSSPFSLQEQRGIVASIRRRWSCVAAIHAHLAAYKTSPRDPLGRTLAPPHFPSPRAASLSPEHNRRHAPLDPAATGAPTPENLAWEACRPSPLLPQPLVKAGAIYSEGIGSFFVLGRGFFPDEPRRRRSSSSPLPSPTEPQPRGRC